VRRTLASVAITVLFLASLGALVGNPVSRSGDLIHRSARVPDTLRVAHLPTLHAPVLTERSRPGFALWLATIGLGILGILGVLGILGPVGSLSAGPAAERAPRPWWAGRAWRAPPAGRFV
jgi:hypothetical protein